MPEQKFKTASGVSSKANPKKASSNRAAKVKKDLNNSYKREQKRLEAALADIKSRIGGFEKIAQKDIDAIEQNLEGYVADLEKEIKQKPISSVGIAAGVGIFIGLLLSRHR